jgi:hypothetical protein
MNLQAANPAMSYIVAPRYGADCGARAKLIAMSMKMSLS